MDAPSREVRRVYDAIADEYTDGLRGVEGRESYEWPVVESLLPTLEGLRVLDAGCGGGEYAVELARAGADVVGVDHSTSMLRTARGRYGEELAFGRVDLTGGLPFADDTFDLVVSQLVLDHLPEWTPVLESFHRVLDPTGHLVVSVDRPSATFLENKHLDVDRLAEDPEYARRQKFYRGDVPFYRRPLERVFDAFFEAGFGVERVREPGLDDPSDETPAIPRFLCLRARA